MLGLNRIRIPNTFDQFWLDIKHVVGQNPEINTLGYGKPNLFKVAKDVISVRTMKSSPKWNSIPKQIFEKVYDYLKKPEAKEVTRDFLLKSLKIYRSAAVSTLLAKLNYIEYLSHIKPITLKINK